MYNFYSVHQILYGAFFGRCFLYSSNGNVLRFSISLHAVIKICYSQSFSAECSSWKIPSICHAWSLRLFTALLLAFVQQWNQIHFHPLCIVFISIVLWMACCLYKICCFKANGRTIERNKKREWNKNKERERGETQEIDGWNAISIISVLYYMARAYIVKHHFMASKKTILIEIIASDHTFILCVRCV